jgi:predicted NACHT family NTPase
LGEIDGEKLISSLDERLLGFCENPYMLTLLALTYRTTYELPSNRAMIYEQFLNQFLLLESKKGGSHISISIKHDLLSDLAFFMGNRIVSIDIARSQKL